MNNIERIISVDPESLEEINDETKKISPLKGILKKTKNNDDSYILHVKLKIIFLVLNLILLTPLTFFDLYFGFTDNYCSKKQPSGLNINLSLYLLVSGFTKAYIILSIIIGICYISYSKINNKNICLLCFASIVFAVILFQTIWNILGAVVYCGYIHHNKICNNTFSSYMFISLIIKIAFNLLTILNYNRNRTNVN
jgi:hypothetical protein